MSSGVWRDYGAIPAVAQFPWEHNRHNAAEIPLARSHCPWGNRTWAAITVGQRSLAAYSDARF